MRNLFGYQRGGPVGRYGEPGRPSLAPRKTIPRATKDPRQSITESFDPVTSYAEVPYDQGWWARVNLRRDLTPQQMHEVYMKHGHPQYSQACSRRTSHR